MAAFGKRHMDLTEELRASGELITSEGLADISLAKRVAVRDGTTLTTDGPFAEAKEYAAGFYVVECDSEERAIEIAAATPDAQSNDVEVWPVLDMSEWDW
jgi:hypothetical protein